MIGQVIPVAFQFRFMAFIIVNIMHGHGPSNKMRTAKDLKTKARLR